MTAKELGEQAAMPVAVAENTSEVSPGLTKRELFAAMAMQARLSNPWIIQNMCEQEKIEPRKARFEIAALSVTMADALLDELAKGQL